MEEYRIPTEDELCELASEYINSLDDEDFPIVEENITDEFLKDLLNEHGYEYTEDQIENLFAYIMSSAETVYEQIIEDISQKFRESLNDAITDADERLSDEDKLKIMIGIACDNFCKY